VWITAPPTTDRESKREENESGTLPGLRESPPAADPLILEQFPFGQTTPTRSRDHHVAPSISDLSE
jgi:hypothetical protein